MSKIRKPTVCFDFDGVIHSYKSGWKGPDVIPDPPVPGALEAIEEYAKHFNVVISSARSGHSGGVTAMRRWLFEHMIGHFDGDEVAARELVCKIGFPDVKPAAVLCIDDRGYQFRGAFPDVDYVKSFRPWGHA